ncbi:protein CUSTOS [Melanotaenia boesemani]|uniref:protein CUSTOS n=1 Tax=Melanotaenia boesemani TaxID=1250792 RepID=UPI001C0419B0|nr:protein CUSTOS [Melanotaenia boesemani]
MAVPTKDIVGVSDDSSSSDDEELKRCQEAVWETKTSKTKDGESNAKESKRVVVADHEHDGNNLQVTQGFQTHVAKKLGHLLDSCVSEIQSETSSHLKATNCEDDDDDDDKGFRLFSTSIPGQKTDEPPAPVRRQPIPSSSDSDSEMEMRLKEAAVSIKDLLPSSTLPSTLSPSSTEYTSLEKIKKRKIKLEGEEGHVVKKKKKRKQNKEESKQVDSAGPSPNQSNGENGNSEQEHTDVKVQRKKKKKRKGNAEENV